MIRAHYDLFHEGHYDPKEFSLADVMRVGFLNSDVQMVDEENQVNGFQVILDFRYDDVIL